MSGSGIIQHMSRIIAAAYVVAVKDSITIVSSLGIVDSAVYNGVGDYTLNFRAPGMPDPLTHPVIPMWSIVASDASLLPTITGTFVSPTALQLSIYRQSGGGPVQDTDFPFTVHILSSERIGGRPLPAPGS